MKRGTLKFAVWLLVAALAVCVPQLAKAQQAADKDVTRGELQELDQWLDKHQDVKADLTKDPNLINDPTYLKNHPNFKAYLDHHPNMRAELKEHPSAFMNQEGSLEKHENEGAASGGSNSGITQTELRNWDSYLDKHSDVRADLTKNPSLIDDPSYLKNHPHLKDFLDHHPNTRAQLKQNPQMFMNREQRYEKSEDQKQR